MPKYQRKCLYLKQKTHNDTLSNDTSSNDASNYMPFGLIELAGVVGEKLKISVRDAIKAKYRMFYIDSD